MDLTHVIDWSREALRMSLTLGGPLLAVALLVGLLVNVGQTLTQLHEPVVGLIPRIAAVALVLLLILPWLRGPMGVVREGLDRVHPQPAVNRGTSFRSWSWKSATGTGPGYLATPASGPWWRRVCWVYA